jgi:hypothetical protein
LTSSKLEKAVKSKSNKAIKKAKTKHAQALKAVIDAPAKIEASQLAARNRARTSHKAKKATALSEKYRVSELCVANAESLRLEHLV